MGIFQRYIRIALIGCLGLLGAIGDSSAITVITPPPLNSGPYAYITNYSSNNVSVIDTATDAVIATIAVGYGPYGVAVSSDATRAYVANYAGNSVSVIDTVTNTVIATVPIATRPYGLAVSPDGSRVYVVAYYTNNVSVIDTATNTVTAVIPVGQRPHGIVVSRDGKRVYVANYATNDVSVIDTTLNSVASTIALPANSNPFGLAQTLDSSKLYVTGWSSNAVYVIDTASNAVTTTVPVGIRPVSVAVTPDASRVYVSNYNGSTNTTVSVIDAASNTVTANIPLPSGVAPSGVSVHPDGGRVYVASYSTGVVYVIDPTTNVLTKSVTVGTRPYAFGSFISLPQPTLALNVPFSGSAATPSGYTYYLNNATPTFSFGYGTQCKGSPCQVSNNYFSTFTLNALFNTQQIGNLTTFSPTPLYAGQPGGTASYTPPSRLADGNYIINAQAQDIFGRLTLPVTFAFTLDTVAPQFLTLSPANGSIYLNPPSTVSGTTDDPTALVTLAGPGYGRSAYGTSFSFPITLWAGLNTLYLTVRDPAGNANYATLNLTYTPFTLTVLTPFNLQTITNNQVTVTGNFSGATTATITVNGTTAVVTGSNFSAANIPLVYGSNLLTVTGTRSDDGKVITKTLTVTSTLPVLTVTTPSNGATLATSSVNVSGTLQAPPYSTVLVNGVFATISGNNYSALVPLVYGANTLTAVLTTPDTQQVSQLINVTSTAPSLTILGPAANTSSSAPTITVTGKIQGPANTIVTVNGIAATLSGDSYSATVPLVYGSNTLTVTATAPSGATASQSVTVTGLVPSLTITSPAAASVINAVTVTVTGTLQAPAGTVVTINGVAATVTGSTFSATVPVNYGGNTLTATAVAPSGLTGTTSVIVSGSVRILTITSPLEGAAINANSVTVSGSFAGSTIATVMVNGVAATVTGSTYTATVPLNFGSNTLTATGTASDGTTTAIATVTVTSSVPTLQINSPADGATINDDTVLVTGVFLGPSNSGVTVNDVVASIDGGKFYANNVPLLPGANTLTVTYTTADGGTLTQTRSVNSTGVGPIQVNAEPSQGVAPLAVSLAIQSQTDPILSVSVDPGGSGTIGAITTSGSSGTIQLTYPSPGTYLATVTVIDSLGTHTQTVAITVLDPVQMDTLFSAIWNGMNNALIAGDKVKAMSYLNSQAQTKYGPVFDSLMPIFAQIVSDQSPLLRSSLSDSIGEYGVVTSNPNGNHVFLIYFLKGTDGVWRLESM